jgi:hypothetical protein
MAALLLLLRSGQRLDQDSLHLDSLRTTSRCRHRFNHSRSNIIITSSSHSSSRLLLMPTSLTCRCILRPSSLPINRNTPSLITRHHTLPSCSLQLLQLRHRMHPRRWESSSSRSSNIQLPTLRIPPSRLHPISPRRRNSRHLPAAQSLRPPRQLHFLPPIPGMCSLVPSPLLSLVRVCPQSQLVMQQLTVRAEVADTAAMEAKASDSGRRGGGRIHH